MPSGPHLAYWDSKDETLVNARGMQVKKLALDTVALDSILSDLSMTRSCTHCCLPCPCGLF